MTHVQFTPGFDVAQLVFYAFVAFFVGLLYYLRREDRREGYPLEDDRTGRVMTPAGPLTEASPKSFRLPHGGGLVYRPSQHDRDGLDLAARPVGRFPGAPLVPTGNPLADGIGPAAWVNRRRVPDFDWEGRPRIVPLSSDAEVVVSVRDPSMLGWTVVGLDRRPVGTVTDLWVDRPDRLVRYLHVALTDGGRSILVPMQIATLERRRRRVFVDAITSDQFAGVPAPEGEGVLTAYDEERIMAYYGGGYLYATPARAEPLL